MSYSTHNLKPFDVYSAPESLTAYADGTDRPEDWGAHYWVVLSAARTANNKEVTIVSQNLETDKVITQTVSAHIHLCMIDEDDMSVPYRAKFKAIRQEHSKDRMQP